MTFKIYSVCTKGKLFKPKIAWIAWHLLPDADKMQKPTEFYGIITEDQQTCAYPQDYRS